MTTSYMTETPGVKMYKREVALNKDDRVEKTDPDPALDEQAGIGLGFLLGIL